MAEDATTEDQLPVHNVMTATLLSSIASDAALASALNRLIVILGVVHLLLLLGWVLVRALGHAITECRSMWQFLASMFKEDSERD